MAATVDDLAMGEVPRHLAELALPFWQRNSIAEAVGVVPVPVGFAPGVLAVVAQQDDAPGAEVLSQGYSPGTGVPAVAENNGFCPWHVLGAGEAFAPKYCAHLGSVFIPPGSVHGVEGIGPGTELKGGVGYDNGAAVGLLTPRPGFFAVVRGEAGAAGDADNGVPAAC